MPGDFDLVKERVDLVQLVGERVALRRAGRAYVGLCPFHAEKTPSFNVDPERRAYRCWGCGEHGDAFTWLEKQDGLDAGEALRVLAERAGVELTRRAPEERQQEKRLLAANETAHFYFRQALRGTPAGHAASAYLAGRGIRPETVERFGLGYAPDIRDGLLGYLRKKGFSDDEAVAAGLVIDHEKGRFDRFRDRLIVPIRDGRGRIVAFGGRAMRAGQPAKYLNSPRTELFDKSATLYALELAKGAMRRRGEAVIVEGYFDAIAAHQAGFDNVVASMGTALTQEQYRVLDRLKIEGGPSGGRAAGRIVVAFDGDAPGQTSAERRGRELAAIVRREVTRTIGTRTSPGVYVALLPPGMDPDELARSDPDRLRATLERAEPVLAFVIEQIRRRSDLVSPDGRRRFLAETGPLLADEPDPLTRELYLGTLSRLTGAAEETLRAQLAGVRREARGAARAAGAGEGAPAGAEVGGGGRLPEEPEERNAATERYLMAQLLKFPEEAARVHLDPTDLADADHRAIYELLRTGDRPGPGYPARLAAVASALGAEAPSPEDEDHAARGIDMAAARLRAENVRRRMGEVRAALNRGSGDVGALMDELASLTEELARRMWARERETVLRSAAEDEDE